jgi:hypothetical protein
MHPFLAWQDSIYIFRWSLSNGACANFSSDDITITAQKPEIANAGPDIYSCEIVLASSSMPPRE